MEKKTILYVGNFDRPEKNAAGKRVYGNALILADIGYEIVLIGKSSDKSDADYPVRYGNSIEYYSFPQYGLRHTKKYIDYLSKVIKSKGDPCFIIRYGSPGLVYFDKKLISFCKKSNIKLIADVVDWLQPGGNNFVFNTVKRIDTYMEKAVYNKKSNGVICISSYLAEFYRSKGCKTLIIPPVVETYSENKSTNDKIVIVYAGMPFRPGRRVKDPSEVKDRLDLTVEAISLISRKGYNVRLDVFGITKEQYLEAYPEQACDVDKMDSIIIFHGLKSMIEVKDEIKKADYTILLRDKNRSTMAGFPTKVVESVSLGTPVITTDTSDLRQYIESGRNGFFVSISSVARLTDDLETIFQNHGNNTALMKQNCFSEKAFLPSCFVRQTESFLNDLT